LSARQRQPRYGWNGQTGLSVGDRVQYVGSWGWLYIDSDKPEQLFGEITGLVEWDEQRRERTAERYPDDNIIGQVFMVKFDDVAESKYAYEGQLKVA
jgi:hypothetical protein